MKLKTAGILSLIGLGIIVLWQNTASVVVSFLFWHFSLPKIFLISGVFLIGLVAGLFINKRW